MSLKRIRALLTPCGAPATAEGIEAARRKTLTQAIVEGSVWSVMWVFGENYVAPYALLFEASNRAMAFIGTVPVVGGGFAQLIGAYLTDRLANRRRLLAFFSTIQALLYLPLAILPWFVREHVVTWVACLWTVYVVIANINSPAWTSLIGDVVPADSRGAYFSRRQRYVTLTMFVCLVFAGFVLNAFQRHGLSRLGFSLFFTLAGLARLISARILALHYEPPYTPPPPAGLEARGLVRRLVRSNYARFALFWALMSGACNISGPFFSVYMLRDLHWSYLHFTLNQAVFMVAPILVLRWWGRMSDRYGNRAVLVATSCVIPILPLLWMPTTRYAWLMALQVLSGVIWSGFSLAAMNFLFDSVPSAVRARTFALTMMFNGLFTLVGGTLVGAWLADHLPATFRIGGWTVSFLSSLPAVFCVSGIVRALIAAALLPRIREVRPAEPIHPILLLYRLSGWTMLMDTLEAVVARLPLPNSRPRGGGDSEQ